MIISGTNSGGPRSEVKGLKAQSLESQRAEAEGLKERTENSSCKLCSEI